MSEDLGYEHEWLPDDDDSWTADEAVIGGKFCSHQKCMNPAAAAFNRPVHRRSTNTHHSRRWYCCADREHMYGRRVVNGVVEFPYMVGSNAWKRAKGIEG